MILNGIGLRDEALKTIGDIRTLESLEIGNNDLTNHGLVQLAGLQALVKLSIAGNSKLDDNAVITIAKNHPKISNLDLGDTQVSDAVDT